MSLRALTEFADDARQGFDGGSGGVVGESEVGAGDAGAALGAGAVGAADVVEGAGDIGAGSPGAGFLCFGVSGCTKGPF
jgi:hypothetical protein